MIKVNNYVQVIGIEEYDLQPAKVLKILEDSYELEMRDNTVKVFPAANVKEKKNCVCGQSARGPWCDGSHSRH